MRRFFTADWHLFADMVRVLGNRPFSDIYKMNSALINDANQRANCKNFNKDVIYHIGDFFKYLSSDKVRPEQMINQLRANVILLEGNHDPNNRVKSVSKMMVVDIGQYKNVTLSHWPSYDEESRDFRIPCHSIHVCGHVHRKFKWAYDKYRDILNINVGVDVWNYHIVSENELEAYITSILKNNLRDSYIGRNIHQMSPSDYVLITDCSFNNKSKTPKEKNNAKGKERPRRVRIQEDKRQKVLPLHV